MVASDGENGRQQGQVSGLIFNVEILSHGSLTGVGWTGTMQTVTTVRMKGTIVVSFVHV